MKVTVEHSQRGTLRPFVELTEDENAAILEGLRERFPHDDTGVLSLTVHTGRWHSLTLNVKPTKRERDP